MNLNLRAPGQLALVSLVSILAAHALRELTPPARIAPGPAPLERPLVGLAAGPPAAAPPRAERPLLRLVEVPERLEVGPGELEVARIVQDWAAARGLVATIDSQLRSIRIALETRTTLDAQALRDVLDFHDVVLVRGAGRTLHAVHRRNLPTLAGPPWDRIEGEAVDPDRIVTRELPVLHGAGNAIFATLRGLLTRDPNRISNILYVQGPERIVITDFAHKVRYYEDMLRSLDQPAEAGPGEGPRAVRLVVHALPRATWAALGSGPASAHALEALTSSGDAERVHDVQLLVGSGAAGVVSNRSGAALRRLSVVESNRGLQVEARFAGVPDAEAQRLTIPFRRDDPRWSEGVHTLLAPDGESVFVFRLEG